MFGRRKKREPEHVGTVLCCVHLPNDSTLNLPMKGDAKGLDLWRAAMNTLSLPEQDFFGLKAAIRRKSAKRMPNLSTLLRRDKAGSADISGSERKLGWVQLNTKLCEQLGPPESYTNEELPNGIPSATQLSGTWHVYVAVKFYVGPTITSWWSHASKELLFHQLRHDIACGLLEVPLDVGVMLGAYAMHVLEGDFQAKKHDSVDYLRKYHFLPSTATDVLKAIQQKHKQCCGMITATDALSQYIDTCQHMEEYGTVFHGAFEDDSPILLGLSPRGLGAYRDKLRLYALPWHCMKTLHYSGKKFYIVLLSNGAEAFGRERLVFEFHTAPTCKEFWQSAVHYHTFFQRQTPSEKSLRAGTDAAVTLQQAVTSSRSNTRLLLQAGMSTEAMRLPTSSTSRYGSKNGSKMSLTSLINGAEAVHQNGAVPEDSTWTRHAVILGETPHVVGGLTAERGEVVDIVDSSDNDWWLVKAAQDVGRVPARMVKEFRCEPHQVVEAASDFTSDDISVNKGDVLFILQELQKSAVVSTGEARGEVPLDVLNFDFAKSRYYEEDEIPTDDDGDDDDDSAGFATPPDVPKPTIPEPSVL